jgi:hypothetical protein
MPKLVDIANTLQANRSRFEYLDAFVDDVDEIRGRALTGIATVVQSSPRLVVAVPLREGALVATLFPEQGIARFQLAGPAPASPVNERVAAAATLRGLLGSALGAASKSKEGLLGGLILGMLVGGVAGAAAGAPERVLAMQFEPASGQWRLYDGPLLGWAKRTLHPAA